MGFHNLKHRILSVILAVAIFNFNLVTLPVQAMDGCRCEHSHGEEGFACFCGTSSVKPSCDSKGPILSKRQCGLEKHADDISIPAHENPSLLSCGGIDLRLHAEIFKTADSCVFACACPLPIEHPPSNSVIYPRHQKPQYFFAAEAQRNGVLSI